MNEEKKQEIKPAPVHDNLKGKSEDDIRAMKAAGRIVYPLASSKDGSRKRSSDGQEYKMINGTLTRWPPVAKLSKKQRRENRKKDKS